MRVELVPEPAPEEQEAIRRVLAALGAGPPDVSRWWEAGIRDAVGDEEER